MDTNSESLVRSFLTAYLRSSQLVATLQQKHNINTARNKWYTDGLLNLFAESVQEGTMMLRVIMDQTDIEKHSKSAEVAWRCRNLLELWVWTQYYLSNQERARLFYDDKVRDCNDWIKAAEKLGNTIARGTPTFPMEDYRSHISAAKQKLVEAAQVFDTASPSNRFKQVSDAATDIGMSQEFASLNKIFSKFAHPTAMTIFTYPDHAERKLISTSIWTIGLVIFLDIFYCVEAYVGDSNSEPPRRT